MAGAPGRNRIGGLEGTSARKLPKVSEADLQDKTFTLADPLMTAYECQVRAVNTGTCCRCAVDQEPCRVLCIRWMPKWGLCMSHKGSIMNGLKSRADTT